MDLKELLAGLEDDIMFGGVAALGADYAVVSLVLKSWEALAKDHTIFVVYDSGQWRQHLLPAATTSFYIAEKDLIFALTPAGVVVRLTADGYESDQIDPSAKHVNRLRNSMELGPHNGQIYVAGMGRECYAGHFRRGWTWLSDEGMTRGQDPVSGFLSVVVEPSGLLHAVGIRGEIWYREQHHWQKVASPTNLRLTRIRMTPFGELMICGASGVLFYGRRNAWASLDGPENENLWDLAAFDSKMYTASGRAVYEIDSSHDVRELDFIRDMEMSAGFLAGTKDCLWSVGYNTIARYDGHTWTRLF